MPANSDKDGAYWFRFFTYLLSLRPRQTVTLFESCRVALSSLIGKVDNQSEWPEDTSRACSKPESLFTAAEID
jgi:hypothetical protein